MCFFLLLFEDHAHAIETGVVSSRLQQKKEQVSDASSVCLFVFVHMPARHAYHWGTAITRYLAQQAPEGNYLSAWLSVCAPVCSCRRAQIRNLKTVVEGQWHNFLNASLGCGSLGCTNFPKGLATGLYWLSGFRVTEIYAKKVKYTQNHAYIYTDRVAMRLARMCLRVVARACVHISPTDVSCGVCREHT